MWKGANVSVQARRIGTQGQVERALDALFGRVLVEYWWPGEWIPELAVYPSPYVETLFSQAGL